MDPTIDVKISERVQIFIHGKDYDDQSGIPISNSCLRVYESDGKNLSRCIYISQICKQSSPAYKKTLILDYFFERRQNLTFRVFVNDAQLGRLKDIPLSHIIQDKKSIERNLLNNQGNPVGKLKILCEKVNKRQERKRLRASIQLKEINELFSCVVLSKKRMFFRINRLVNPIGPNHEGTILYQSSVMASEGTINWEPFIIQQSKLCQNNQHQQFSFHLFYQSLIPTEVGSVTLTLAKINTGIDYTVKLDGKAKAKICFIKLERIKDQTFFDFLKSGLQVKTAIAIDFTESNGRYTEPDSKHYFGDGNASEYEKVMNSVLDVALQYNEQKNACVLGFGAVVKSPTFDTNGKVSLCFPVNMNVKNPYLHMKKEIIDQYRKVMPYLTFAGPTLLLPLLKWAKIQCEQIKKNKQLNQYMLLFVLADGQYHDKQETDKFLLQLQVLPLSLIIIGIGLENFTLMEDLNKPVPSIYGRHCRRLTKFISYEKVKNQLRNLVDEILSDIHKQVEEYFKIMDEEQRRQKEQIRRGERQNTVTSLTRRML